MDRRAIDRVRLRKTYKNVPDVPPSATAPATLRHNDYVVGDSLELMGNLPERRNRRPFGECRSVKWRPNRVRI